MKHGDKVKVPGFVLSVTDGIAEIGFAGTYPKNGQRIRIAVVAIDPEDIVDTGAAIQNLASSEISPAVRAELAAMRAKELRVREAERLAAVDAAYRAETGDDRR